MSEQPGREKFPFSLDSDFVFEVWSSLDAAQRERTEVLAEAIGDSEDWEPRIPTEDELEIILSTAFWASMTREEDRPVRFSLDFTDRTRRGFTVLTFEEPIPFTSIEIAKVALAFEESAMRLAVWPMGDQQELKIWGAVRASDALFQLRVLRAGRLVADLEGGLAAVLTGTRCGVVLPRKITIAPGRAEGAPTESGSHPGAPKVEWEILRPIVSSMYKHGHGGTLLVVQGNDWQESLGTPMNYGFRRPYVEAARFSREMASIEMKAQAKHPATFAFRHDHEYVQATSNLSQALDAIGRFTAIDGATVLDTSLEVMAIGVKIQPSRVESKDFEIGSEDLLSWSKPKTVRLSDLKGTRHSSAAQYVFEQQSCLAFVSSQDGAVSLFRWEPTLQRVAWIRNLEMVL